MHGFVNMHASHYLIAIVLIVVKDSVPSDRHFSALVCCCIVYNRLYIVHIRTKYFLCLIFIWNGHQ